MKLNKKITAAMATVAALFGSVAHADVTDGSFKISTTVVANCVLEVATIDLGEFTAQAIGETTGSGKVTVTCSSGLPYTVDFKAGVANGEAKYMTSTSSQDKLYYSLKAANPTTDNAQFEVGEGAGKNLEVAGSSNTGAPQEFPLSVTVANNQYVATGEYKDTVTATVTY